MNGANDLTEDSFTKEELDTFAELKLYVGSWLTVRGEICLVKSVDPLAFSMRSDMDNPAQELARSARINMQQQRTTLFNKGFSDAN